MSTINILSVMLKKNEELILLGQKIKTIRIDKKLSQEQLASKCDFDRTYISMLERGKRNPSYLNLLKLCNGLEITINRLLED